MADPALSDFIWQHRFDDPHRLALMAMPAGWSAAYIAHQVDALQRLRHKVPGWYVPGLQFPAGVSVEQASSERTARYKAGLVSGSKAADLTGGLGVDAFFLAQHFDAVWYIEQSADIAACARHNLRLLGAERVHTLHTTAEEFLTQNTATFDLLYLDPARRDGVGGRVFRLEDCTPNVLALRDVMLQTSPCVLLKTAPLLDLRRAVEQLQRVTRIWVVAVDGECREVLYLLEREGIPTEQVSICATHLLREGEVQAFTFNLMEEREAEVQYSPPLAYLYEPHAAVLKAGAFRCFAQRYGLKKLHANTHLYTSADLVEGVPGRTFSIETVCRYDRKTVHALLPERRAHVSVRNFPDSSDQVRKRLALQDGGSAYLFAATDAEGKKIIVGKAAGRSHAA